MTPEATVALAIGIMAMIGTGLPAADDFLDPLEEALAFSADHDTIRARLSGALDLEGYSFSQPAPALIVSNGRSLFTPRLTLYLDAQLGPYLYAFAETRTDRGFDPANGDLRTRLDECALRFTPWEDGRLNLQIGKFATIVGNWTLRHDSWDNPFITAPLPYENLTGIWDAEAARTASVIALWANLGPHPSDVFPIKSRSLPIIWGPSYASGASLFGSLGEVEYAAELKNADLSSRPESWNPSAMRWDYPTASARLGLHPDPAWTLGVSASAGSYLRPFAYPTVAPGAGPGQYRETLFGQDAAFAHHHWQVWSEVYETRFEVPGVGDADTVAYYIEAKYKFTPQFSGALRWNEQLFATLPDPLGGSDRWGANAWRIDLAPAYRFTAHLQLKLQYSFERQSSPLASTARLAAAQLTARF